MLFRTVQAIRGKLWLNKLNMNTKTVTLLIIGAILLVAAGVFVLSLPAKNTKIEGDIKVGSGNATPTSASPAPLVVSQGVITITDNGATPSRADVAVGKSLQIINKTTGDVTLTMTGMVNKSIVVGAGKTVNSEVFIQAGEIKAVASNNKSSTCTIEVK